MVVDNKKIVSNTIALYIRMIVVMAINFYMSRVVLDVLGVIDYGIYNLVATIVVVFSFLKSSFSDATQRFINYTIGNGKHTQLSKIFSTCLTCYFRFLSVRLNRLKNRLLANYLRNRGNDLATVRNSAFCVAILSNNSFICKYNIFFRKYELSVAIL